MRSYRRRCRRSILLVLNAGHSVALVNKEEGTKEWAEIYIRSKNKQTFSIHFARLNSRQRRRTLFSALPCVQRGQDVGTLE
jgi:hypothetical protein